MSDLVRYVARQTPGTKPVPEWARTAILNERTDEVFAPAMSDKLILCAMYDGEPAVNLRGHTYVRTAWLRNQSGWAETADKIERMVRECAAEDRTPAQ
jgi:hypothetical protein